MDGPRFDAWTRRLARGGSGRGADSAPCSPGGRRLWQAPRRAAAWSARPAPSTARSARRHLPGQHLRVPGRADRPWRALPRPALQRAAPRGMQPPVRGGGRPDAAAAASTCRATRRTAGDAATPPARTRPAAAGRAAPSAAGGWPPPPPSAARAGSPARRAAPPTSPTRTTRRANSGVDSWRRTWAHRSRRRRVASRRRGPRGGAGAMGSATAGSEPVGPEARRFSPAPPRAGDGGAELSSPGGDRRCLAGCIGASPRGLAAHPRFSRDPRSPALSDGC